MEKVKMKQKGEGVEKGFIEWLNRQNIPFWYIRQNWENSSTALTQMGVRRLDFILFGDKRNFIFVDVKHNKPAERYKVFHIDANEIDSYLKLENITGVKTWLAFSSPDYHFTIWHWIPVEKVAKHKLYSRKGDRKKYYAVPLDEFVVVTNHDNLDKIIQSEKSGKAYSVEEIRRKYPKAYGKWSEEDDRLLREEYKKGKKIRELGELFQRKTSAIRSRLIKLGLIKE